MAQKDVDMKDAAEEDHQKEGDKQKEPDEQQAKKDKDLLAFEGKPQFFESHPNCCVQCTFQMMHTIKNHAIASF